MNESKVIATNEDAGAETDSAPSGTVAIVYDYTRGDYDGSGVAIAVTASGDVYEKDLSHCSCYGPFGYDSREWTKVSPTPTDLVRFCEVDEMGVDRTKGYDSAAWARLREGVKQLAALAAAPTNPNEDGTDE